MQCAKMKIVGALFLLGCLRMCLSDNQGEAMTLGFPITSEMCPYFLKSIQENTSQFKTICNYTATKSAKSIEIAYLKKVCILVRSMLSFICKESRIQEFLNFNFVLNNTISICPIKIGFSEKEENLDFNDLKQVLANPINCTKICYDFNEVQEQCTILNKLNAYINTFRNHSLLSSKDLKSTIKFSKTDSSVSNSSVTVTSGNISELSINKGDSFKLNVDDGIKSKINSKQENYEYIKSSKQTEKSEFHLNKIETAQNGRNLIDMSNVLEDTNQSYKGNEEPQDVTNYETKPSSALSASINKEITDEDIKLQKIQKNKSDSVSSTLFITSKGITESMMVDDENIEESERLSASLSQNNLDSEKEESQLLLEKKKTVEESSNQNVIYSNQGYFQAEESHFFFHFLMLSSVAIIGYFAFHNKNKILAYALEGRNSRRQRRRPNSANYKKLESNLEEAIVSDTSQAVASNVVY